MLATRTKRGLRADSLRLVGVQGMISDIFTTDPAKINESERAQIDQDYLVNNGVGDADAFMEVEELTLHPVGADWVRGQKDARSEFTEFEIKKTSEYLEEQGSTGEGKKKELECQEEVEVLTEKAGRRRRPLRHMQGGQ